MTDCWVYAGLAGDTDPGRFVSAGLYRSRNGAGAWENLSAQFETAPQVRAILTNPLDPNDVLVGAQDGIWRSKDAGESWQRLSAPKPELSVWSLFRHPKSNQTLFAGYEPCAIYRSTDDGRTWSALPIGATFPEITMTPEAFPKRVLSMAIDPYDPNLVYAAIEIGGLLRSRDGGSSWEAAIDGVYVTEDSVDVHSVVTDSTAPGTVTIATRIGVFKSENRGERWRHLGVPKLRPQGSYCRFLAPSPDDPRTLYLAGGNDFDGDKGAFFVTKDSGSTWSILDLGVPLKTALFAIAIHPKRPNDIFCTTKVGQVFHSGDRGKTWTVNALPPGVGHVFSLAVG
jgi:photosystem II stability/assembly factor-like uncharacterized protein